MALYVDTSALVKLVRRERETTALRAFIAGDPDLVVSIVGAIELWRAIRRAGEGEETVDAVLAGLTLVSLTEAIASRATTLGPPTLRSLDAIHLATALELGGELAAVVTYDARLAEAAAGVRLAVIAPGGTRG